jgi:phage shock protein PspC (stress-responsive transcriptional regulator)
MKKTIIVTINGIIFHVDEDAYEVLQSYLDTLRHYFSAESGAAEIIEDIEARIAELFQPRISEAKQSISLQDIDEIIEILGKPEDIAGANDENYEARESHESSTRKSNRRLYRDPEHSVLGGVCAGLGAYFAVDMVVFRLLFIVFLFAGGASVLVYLILWIAVPAAFTAAQKLEMHGEEVNISNIERTFRREYQQVKNNLSRLQPQGLWLNIHNFLNEFFMLLGKLLGVVWSILRVIFGISLILTSLGIAITTIGFIYFNNFNSDSFIGENIGSLKEYLNCFISPGSSDTLLMLLLCIIAFMVAGLIYGGLKLMVRFYARDRWLVLALVTGWFFMVIAFVIMVSDEVRHFKIEQSTREILSINKLPNNIIYVDATSSIPNDNEKTRKLRYQHFDVNNIDKHKELFGLTKIDIEKSNGNVPEMEIERQSRGETRDIALTAAQRIKVNVKQNDTLLNVDPFFRLPYDQLWRWEEAKVILRLPVGTRVHLNENTRYLIEHMENINGYWNEDMAGKTWIMTADGLSKENN